MNHSNWAQSAIDSLRRGETCTLIHLGGTLRPRIRSGATVTLMPLSAPLSAGDVVLVDLPETSDQPAQTVLHLILGVCDDADTGIESVLVGDAHGDVGGWANTTAIYGRVVAFANLEPRTGARERSS